VYKDIAANESGVQVQITTTMPSPWGEQSIAETWLNAVAQAKDYILIEDQYWRAPLLVEAILARMEAVPTLRLVVITKPVDTWVDPGCEWTHLTHQWLQTQFPDRYRVYQLRVFELLETWGFNETEGHFADMDVHSKMFIVDDTFMSVGSCNKNNRGLLYEGEMNVAVFDADWVRTERKKILSNILPADTPAADDVADWWVQLEVAASYNALVYAKWENVNFELNLETFFDSVELPDSWVPKGFVYPLSFGLPVECFFEGVGPDST
jgi:phosphatidylserine/phosphatidylglycerophosphate/cardiolipin synthase-like enzyme